MANSKAKGSAFEREICKRLTLWLTGQQKEVCFWRSAGSGAVYSINAKKGNAAAEMSGDISGLTADAMKICALINFELKTGYESADLNCHLKANKIEPLRSFWEQSCRDAKATNKEPLVIFRRKRMPNIWCGMSVNFFNKFETLKDYRFIMLTWGKEFKELPAQIFMNLEEFLTEVKPEFLLNS